MGRGTKYAGISDARQETGTGSQTASGRSRSKSRSGWIRNVSELNLGVAEWAEENFGNCDLGDARRTRRTVKVAQQMAEHPDGTTPTQCESWPDLKAAYRLFDCDDVTFSALAEPHWKQTRQQARGRVLVIGDTMATDFGKDRKIAELKPTKQGAGRGFLLHNSMMVDAGSGEIIGLAGQELFYQKPAPKNESASQRSKRPRESEVWGRVIDQIGPPPDEAQYVHVFDRGADNQEVFCHLVEQRSDWVIRAAQLHRVVYDSGGNRTNLQKLLAQQPVLGTYELEVRGTAGQPKRTAKLEVRSAQATIRQSTRMTPYLKRLGFEELTQWVVEVRETDPPPGVESLRWVLWTSLPAGTFDLAWLIIEYYEWRWLIEEFHKAMKTGCRLEDRQYETTGRLEAVAGIISVLAVRLLQMKTIARAEPNRPAEEVVPAAWLTMLRALRKTSRIRTIRDFVRHLVGLGGFLMRKGDGEPGWITIWRGVDKLLLALRGYDAMR